MRLYLNGPLQEELSAPTAPDAILLLAHYANGVRAKILRYRLTRQARDEADYEFVGEDGELVIDRRIAEQATVEAARAAKTEALSRARERQSRARRLSGGVAAGDASQVKRGAYKEIR